MPLVVDASVTLCWILQDERSEMADRALVRAQADVVVVPEIWWLEIENVLLVKERQGRIEERQAADFLVYLSALDVTVDNTPVRLDVLAAARRHRLTVYDASYLELAKRRDLVLATLDRDLRRASARHDVTPFE